MTSAQVKIGDVLSRYMAGSNLLGRLHVVRVALKKTRSAVQLYTGSRLQQRFAEGAAEDGATFDAGWSFSLPSTGALDYLRDLTPVTKTVFDGLSRQYQQDAFTIAGVSDQKLLARIRDELQDVLAHGGTRADFEAAVNKMTDAAGVDRLAAFELDTVFSTNTAKAYSAGRFEQMNEDSVVETLPFWQFWTVGDDRVRPEHRVLDGFTARAGDPVWRKIYPPCGYNCRCSVVPILAEEAPEDAHQGGLERLPLLAKLKVPQPGFRTVIG